VALGVAGDTCASVPFCGPGLDCGGTGTQPTCVPKANLGESCASLFCADGLFCGPTQVCQAPIVRGLGQSCSDLVEPCLVALGNSEGGGCDSALHVCVGLGHPVASGPCGQIQHCNNAQACHGLTLLNDGGVTPGSCGAASAGESCVLSRASPSLGFAFHQCQPGQRCAQADGGVGGFQVGALYAGTCQTITSGGPCTSQLDCLDAEACTGDFETPGKCVPRSIAEGASCDSLVAGCAVGLTCFVQVGGLSVCRHLGASGEPCAQGLYPSDGCVAGLTCVSGTCRLAGMPGGVCDNGQCIVGACDAGRCLPPGASGPCSADAECESFRCRGGQCQLTCQ
jgi:hypothetical protein